MTERRKNVVRYRIEQADDAVRAARMLLENGMPRQSVGRSYYAMFYGVLALLAVEGQGTSKHSRALAMFDMEFIRGHKLPKQLSDWLHKAFELRLQADYQEFTEVSRETAAEALEHAATFVSRVRDHLEGLMGPEEQPES